MFPILQCTARVPWGYERVGETPDFEMNETAGKLLNEAMDLIDTGASFREMAAWLSAELPSFPVSHQGVRNLWVKYRGHDPENPRAQELAKAKDKNKPKTREEIKKARALKEKAATKRRITRQKQRLAKFEEAPEVVEIEESYSYDSYVEPKSEIEQEVIFKPNPGPQIEFLQAAEQEVLYGGAAGGGKSYALLADAMRYFHHPMFNGLLLRRTNDELRELKWKSQMLYPLAFKGAKWSNKDSTWTFPSGAKLWMTYLERDEDVLRYQGQAFTWIAVDELTQYATPFAWDYLRSRLRGDPGIDKVMRATTNPGGPGHHWVKRMFIDPSPAKKSFYARDLETNEVMVHPEKYPANHPTLANQPNPRAGQPLFKRKFIPASLYDNPYLLEDGSYEASLLSLPEDQRRKLLEGDWSVTEGAAFPEFRPSVHVIEPFEIPDTWRRFRSCDFGYSSNSAVHWWAIDPTDETLICYRELYVSRYTGEALADTVLSLESGESIQYGILDSSVWHQRGNTGPTIAEVMIARGCRWRPSDRSQGSRIAGKNRLHELLKITEDEHGHIHTGIKFFNNCRQIITDLPMIPSDPKGSDDIDPRYASDHAYDSVRYAIMSRPRSASVFDGMGKTTPSWRPSDSQFGY